MRQIYLYQKSQPLVDQISCLHYTLLLSLKDINKINYYIKQCITHSLSKRELERKINKKRKI